MKKLERQREQKRRQQVEDTAVAKMKAAEAGHGFVDHELPPEEVDEKEVQRSIWYTLKTFVPYSNEYYEAMAAEEEMDDLKKIRVEKVRATDFLTMSKMGRHDDALDAMMAETNYDFFYFNKLKFKMEAEGKFKFEGPRSGDSVFGALSQGPNRNRLRKAINVVFTAFDNKTTDELARLAAFSDGSYTQKKYGNDQPCMWRGKNKSGEALRCDNGRLARPERESKMEAMMGIQTAAAAGSKQPVEYFAYCAYHVPCCISANHEVGQNVKIRIPNSHSLCAECFMMEHRKRPPALRMDNAPGVLPANFKVSLSEHRPDDESMTAYMRQTVQRELMKYFKNRHFATPRHDPQKALQMRLYQPLPPAETWVQKMGRIASQVAYKRRYVLHGRRAATKIQATYRMHRLYQTHVHMHYERMINKRWQAAIAIQSAIRRFRESRFMKLLRQLYNKSCTIIQQVFRGFRTRYRLLRRKSGLRILKFMKKIYFFKFKDAVLMIMQLRLLFIKRNRMTTHIQRLFRGYGTRCLVFQIKYWRVLSRSFARKIQRAYRQYVVRKSQQPRRVPGEDYVYAQIAQRLYRHISQLFLRYKSRRLVLQQYQQAAPFLQQTVRMFLAKRGARKLAQFREQLREAIAPRFALGVYQSLLANRAIDQHIYSRFVQPLEAQAVQAYKEAHKVFVRKFLPQPFREYKEVHYKLFLPALLRYYQSVRIPLSETEQAGLLKRFRNPLTGGVYVEYLDEFISFHPDPCFKHGRHVCGSCVYRKECSVGSCKCNAYRPHPEKKGLCESCFHAKHLHKVYPQQAKQAFRKLQKQMLDAAAAGMNSDLDSVGATSAVSKVSASSPEAARRSRSRMYENASSVDVLALFAMERNADMSLPVGVHGTAIGDVLVPAVDYDDLRHSAETQQGGRGVKQYFSSVYADKMARTGGFRTVAESQLWQDTVANSGDWLAASAASAAHVAASTKLGLQLAHGEREGDSVKDDVTYWQQPHVSVVKPSASFRSIDQVVSSNRIPTNVSVHTSRVRPARARLSRPATSTAASSANPSLVQRIEQTFSSLLRDHDASGSVAASITTSAASSLRQGANHVAFSTVSYAPEAPGVNVNFENFWAIAAKNPNKSVRQYHDGFSANMPMPMVVDDRIVYTIEFPEVYLNVLNMLIYLEPHIHSDDPIFLKLVFNHIQVFERHWRDMVIDLRAGRASSKLAMNSYHAGNADVLDIFNNVNVPRPQLAEKLDQIFRTLGFHKKVLGKDITIQAYAPKKSQRELDQALLEDKLATRRDLTFGDNAASSMAMLDRPTTRERRPSLSFEPSEGAVQSMSRPPSRLRSPGTRPATAEGRAASPPLGASSRPSTAQRSLAQTLRDIRDATLEQSSENPNAYSRGASRESGALGGSPSKKRRHSHSESQRAADREELQDIHYDLLTAPREIDVTQLRISHRLGTDTGSRPSSKQQRKHSPRKALAPMAPLTTALTDSRINLFSLQSVVKLGSDRYVCPVPGCGKSFFSTDSCFRHMKVHENKQRLAVATPLGDAHLQFYWPRDIPWSSTTGSGPAATAASAAYCQTALPPGALRCQYADCGAIFSSAAKLHNHLRLVHKHLHPSHRDQQYYTTGAAYLSIPPEPVPYATLALPYCASHMQPLKSCSKCMEVDVATRGGPKGPYKLLRSAVIDLKARRQKLHVLGSPGGTGTGSSGGAEEYLTLRENDRAAFLLIEDERSAALQKARCLYLVFDRRDLLWVGVERLYNVHDLLALGPTNHFNVNDLSSPDELVPQHLIQGRDTCSADDVTFVPVHTVHGAEGLVLLTVAQSRLWQRKASSAASQDAAHFIRADRLY